MMLPLPWPVLGSFVACALSLYFVRRLWPYRREPGGWLFIATILCEAIWTGAHGAALLVYDPALRWLFEIPIWFGRHFIVVLFLAFALEYTGRGEFVRSKWMGLLVAIQTASFGLVVTNPLHHLAWSNYHVDPSFGAATSAYTHQPWLFGAMFFFYFVTALAVVLLLEAFASYGPLYRGQTIALALSPVLPFVTSAVWLFELTPHSLDLTTVALTGHLAFDYYAFFRRNMFEQTPAARRIGERAALDDLGTPVVIVDTDYHVIDANEEAGRVFDFAVQTGVGEPLNAVLGESIDASETDQSVMLRTDGEYRQYRVISSNITDSTDTHIGYTLVFQDVTTEKRREQRLEVLNRVLRHNLRNDLNTITGYAEVIPETDDDDLVERHVETISKTGHGLVDLGDKARQFEQAMKETTDHRVDLAKLVAGVVEDVQADYPDARVEIDLPEGLEVETDPSLARLVFGNIVENGLEHNTADDPRVEIELADDVYSNPNPPSTDWDESAAVVEVRDNGPGIPDHEVTVISEGEERDLEHGSGLGLWIVHWGTSALGGDLSFDRDDGTVVSVRLPGLRESSVELKT